MKNKITQFIPAVLALAVIGFRYFGLWCTEAGNLCYRTWLDRTFLEITNPLDSFARYFLVIALVLIFIPRSIFISWLKFAAWAIPLSILYIAMTPVIDNSLIPFSRDDAARLAGELFTAASLVLIIWKYFSSRRSID
ncbi:MAG: hypothetical protein Q8P23_00630 [bacterium]|nr:hypothetical protein [bacterium]